MDATNGDDNFTLYPGGNQLILTNQKTGDVVNTTHFEMVKFLENNNKKKKH